MDQLMQYNSVARQWQLIISLCHHLYSSFSTRQTAHFGKVRTRVDKKVAGRLSATMLLTISMRLAIIHPLAPPSAPLLLPITPQVFQKIPIDTEFDESGVLSLCVYISSQCRRALILFVDPHRAKS
jgi:hypothetical protein